MDVNVIADDNANESSPDSLSPKILNRFHLLLEGSRKGYFALYVLVFALMFVCYVFGVFINGKSFIWRADGLEQQYMFFIMEGQWLRDLLYGVFISHDFTIPMWSEQIGYGGDYFVSLMNTLGNPINLISVFANPKNAEWLLQATVPITLFLAGLAFIGYCRYKGIDRMSALIASMVYIFGGYSLVAFHQIHFVYPLLLGVLILWGADRLFDGKSPLPLIFAMALCFMWIITTGYAACLLLFVYCLVRFFNLKEKPTLKGFFSWLGKFSGCVALGLLIGCVLFLPQAIVILSEGRVGLERPILITYSLEYYLRLFEGFLNYAVVGSECIYGFAPIVLICLVTLFTYRPADVLNRKRKRVLVILFAVLSVFICLPVFGKIFNGFAYPNNRWVWAYCLLVSVICAYCLPKMREVIAKGKKTWLALIIVYCLIGSVIIIWFSPLNFYASMMVLFATIVFAYAFKSNSYVFGASVLATVAFSTFFVTCTWGGFSGSLSQVGIGKAYTEAYENTAFKALAEYVESSTDSTLADVRYDSQAISSTLRNSNWANGMQSNTFYNSLYNGYVDEYHTSLGLVTSFWNHYYNTLNSRTIMDALAGTEYFIVPNNDSSYLPPRYDEKVLDGQTPSQAFSAYRSDVNLPLAFTYASAISRETYDSLGLADRQDVLVQSVVVEDMEGQTEGEFKTFTESIPYKATLVRPENADSDLVVQGALPQSENTESIVVDGNSITVKKPSAVLYLEADIPKGTEAYFICDGMNFDYSNAEESDADSKVFAQQLRDFINGLVTGAVNDCRIYVNASSSSNTIWWWNRYHELSGGKDDWCVNLGYSDKERHTVALQFDQVGIYTFDSFGIYAQETENVLANIEELATRGAQNIQKFANGYSCDVDITQDGEYLYFRVPYSKGWSATVDGSPAEVLNANVGFMALKLDEGDHHVVLRYETPGLKIGVMLTLAGLLGTVAVFVFRRLRKVKASSMGSSS